MFNDLPFATWLESKKVRILELGKLVGQAAPPETSMGRESWLNVLADRISDNLQEILELHQESENYWLEWCRAKIETLEGAPKSRLDLAKNIDCKERRVYKYLESLLKTCETRASLTQSCLKFYRSV